MSTEPIQAGTLIEEWVHAKQTEQDTLHAWHDVQTPELLTAWVNAHDTLIDTVEQLELELNLTPCTQSSDGPYWR